MPVNNDDKSFSGFSAPNLPSADDLDRVAEELELKTRTSAVPVPSVPANLQSSKPEEFVNKVNNTLNRTEGQCFRCENIPITFCRHCGQEFCQDHKSRYSEGICCLCVASDNLGIQFVDYIEEDMDAEGNPVKHRGRRIKLIGEGWPNTMQMIDDLSDEALEVFIAERQRLLQEAVKLSEYHRITLAKAEFTKEYKRRSKIAKLRSREAQLKTQGGMRVSGKVVNIGEKRSAQPSEAKLAASLGISIEQLRAVKKLAGAK